MQLSLVYIFVSVTGAAIGQVLLKQGMKSLGPLTLMWKELPSQLFGMLTNPFVILGLIFFVASTVFWLSALSRVDLSFAYPFASLSYVLMLFASWQFFGEEITPLRLVGTITVALGVILISRT